MLYFTAHARQRMQERGLSESEVEYCLANYDVCYRDSRGNLICRCTLPSRKGIKVVVAEGSANPRRIITVADFPVQE